MACTETERQDIQRNMFGCLTTDIRSMVVEQMGRMCNKPSDIARSILSDAQEAMEMGHIESARKKINIAKFILTELI